VAFFGQAYSDDAQSIAAAARGKGCRMGYVKWWDVIGWNPMLFAVKNNWW
jgi:hypothetical protein